MVFLVNNKKNNKKQQKQNKKINKISRKGGWVKFSKMVLWCAITLLVCVGRTKGSLEINTQIIEGVTRSTQGSINDNYKIEGTDNISQVDNNMEVKHCKLAGKWETLEQNNWFYKVGWAASHKVRNKVIKTITGNGRNALNISHWNMGSRQWPKKKLEIRHFLEERKPDIYIITEANLLEGTTIPDRWIEGYQ